ncbi:MAG: type VI secretion system contractile sheath large subunit [Nannocystis sp.]|jgi:type VI secretion system protein ImpC|nr:type VI secretion system contractile sheath large subunit [Nannocystis sp.]
MNDLNVTPRPSLLTELLEEAKLDPASDTTVRGLSSLLTELLRAPGEGASQRLAKSKVDALIEDIDKRLTAQVNAILHTPEVKGLETAWRGAKYLVDAVDFRENIRLELVNATKVDLLTDFRDAPEITHTGLYRTLYKSAFGVFGGRPYGVICSTHDFGPGADDVELLRGCAAIAAMSHAPFITNTNPDMFGKGSFAEIPQLKDLQATFESPRYARWNAFRDSEDARYVGLCMPRFLLRAPYGGRESEIRVRDFDFSEEVIDQHERYLWGPASIALTAKIAESFAAHRWCPNIIGPQGGGAVFNLPLHQYHQGGELKTKNPCEAAIDDRKEFELAEQGFIALTPRKDSNNAAFFSANSAQRPKVFARTPEGQAAQVNHTLGTRLPYMFVITRLAHYLKVLQREQIGNFKSRTDLERELGEWIRQYVSDMVDPPASVRSRKPLAAARITVEEVPGQVGWYRCGLTVKPHLKYEGASFELSLVGKLDKE